jgi:hypothetical protein
MSAPSPFFLQQSGSAQITLTRPPPSAQGPLSVEFNTDSVPSPESLPATTNGESVPTKTIAAATPGQQYLPVDETVTFQPGQTALTVSVPIVPNAANPGIVRVEMTATPLVSGGFAETGEFAILSGPDQLPLAINNAQIVQEGSGASGIALTFNEPMVQASVENLQNYRITPAPRAAVTMSHTSRSSEPVSSHGSAPSTPPLGGLVAGASLAADFAASALGYRWHLKSPNPPPIPLQSATYDAATSTVVLVTKKPLNPARSYQVAIDSGMGTPRRREHNPGNGGDIVDQGGGSLTWISLQMATPQSVPPVGANLVDLSRSLISYFTASPTSFDVSSLPSGPARVTEYTRPLNVSVGCCDL